MSLGLGVCILVLSMYSSTAAVTATFLQRGVNTRATAMGEAFVALRLGYKSNQEAGSGVTAGMGVKVGRLHLDYAHVDYGYFGITHRVSLGWKW